MKNRFLKPNAVAFIKGGNQAKAVYGRVDFYQKKDFVLIEANIDGLPRSRSGFFGFHIHDGTNCGGEGFSDTGNHYNPKKSPHPMHSGDLPPLMLCNGSAYSVVATDRFDVNEIIGKTVVIHGNPDDFTSQPSGNAGTKIACGVIEKRHA